jgi:hypothetical protein
LNSTHTIAAVEQTIGPATLVTQARARAGKFPKQPSFPGLGWRMGLCEKA